MSKTAAQREAPQKMLKPSSGTERFTIHSFSIRFALVFFHPTFNRRDGGGAKESRDGCQNNGFDRVRKRALVMIK